MRVVNENESSKKLVRKSGNKKARESNTTLAQEQYIRNE
jgi:hypothetical protein